MQGFPRRLFACRPRPLRDEAGFAMVEVIVSAVVLIVLALSTLAVIDRSQSTSSNNRSRAVASQLAQAEQDAIRQMPMSQLAGGYHPGTVKKAVGEITYDVTTTADWAQDSGGAVTCSTNTGRVEYLATETTVTWPGMGSIKPVVANSVVSPGVAALGANKGALTVLLSRADGTGTQGITVTVQGNSAVTDENGCAVIGNLDAGSQTLTYSAPGYVDQDSVQNISRPVTIGAGTIAQTTGFYDQVGKLSMTIKDDTGAAANWPKVSIDHTNRSKPSNLPIFTDTPGQQTASIDLFPFTSPYRAYVGECAGNDPANKLYTGSAGAVPALITSGNTTTATLVMRTVTINTDNVPYSVYVAPEKGEPGGVMNTTDCTSYYKLAVTPAKVMKVPLPIGAWRVCLNFNYGTSPKWRQVKTAATSPLVVSPSGTTATNYVYNASPSTPTIARGSTTGNTSTETQSC